MTHFTFYLLHRWYWQNQKQKPYVDFMQRNYPPDFKYQDFAPLFTAEFFDAKEWTDIFASSGAKYIVLTTKHHEGTPYFCASLCLYMPATVFFFFFWRSSLMSVLVSAMYDCPSTTQEMFCFVGVFLRFHTLGLKELLELECGGYWTKERPGGWSGDSSSQ